MGTSRVTNPDHASPDDRDDGLAQAALDALMAQICVLDHRGVIIAVNEAWVSFARQNGHPAPVAVCVGADYPAVCRRAAAEGDHFGEAAWHGIGAVLRGDSAEFSLEYPCHSADERRWFLMSATPLRRPAGGAVISHLDVSARRAAEAERDRLTDELREADRRKDEFLGMLGHELRNPLAAIGGALALMRRGADRADREWAEQLIGRQAGQLNRLVDDLLDVSRIATGKLELRQEVLEAGTLVGRALEVVRPLVEQRRQSLEVATEPGPMMMRGDPVRLEQVLVNLLTNAAKYTDEGGAIRLVSRREGEAVVIEVADSGIGIAPEMVPRIFDLYAQVDGHAARSQGGLGIGLALVRNLVELHGGSVAAWSEGVGRGSVFSVRLPAIEPPPGPLAWDASSQRPGATTRRVLLIDDNRDTAKTLGILLRGLGHEVEVAHDGRAGFEAARSSGPEVVLLDIGLPGMDGYQVAERLRREPGCAAAVLVALSGYGREEDRRRARDAGFDHYLVKPVELSELTELLGRSEPSRG